MPISVRHVVLAAALAPLAGCATSASAPPVEGTTQSPVRLGGGAFGNAELRTTTTTTTETAAVEGAPEKAYEALLNAFGVLTLTPNNLSPATYEVGIVDARVRRRLGRDPLSRFLNCGDNVQTGPNADSYDVVLTVRSRLTPVAGEAARSTLGTIVSATARPSTTSGNTITCSSTGLIERRIADNVQAQLAKAR